MNITSGHFYIILLTCFILVSTMSGCGLQVPVKEMSLAHYTITGAREVKAEKYAPDEYKEANEKLYQSHQLLKDEKDSAAKKAAEESLALAKKAIEKSLPPLAQDTLAEAKAKYEEATLLDAENLAPDEYKETAGHISTAETLFGETSYRDSYQASLSAITSARGAIDKSRQSIPGLEEKIASLRKKADTIAGDRGDEFAATELALARQHLSDATASLKNANIQNALPGIAEAEKALEIAQAETEKGRALESLDAARGAYTTASEHKNASLIKEKLSASANLIAAAEESLKQKSYTDSQKKSREALTILNEALISMEKRSEEEKEKEGADLATDEKPRQEYVVKYKPGNRDCLWRIAHKVYNNARLWPYIYIANRDQIKDPDLIYPGQKFVIPSIPDSQKEMNGENIETGDTDEENGTDTTEKKDEVSDKPEDAEDGTGDTAPDTE
ncbi:MAG: DUF4398 domain-containing protein [Spirochaetota bacterium]